MDEQKSLSDTFVIKQIKKESCEGEDGLSLQKVVGFWKAQGEILNPVFNNL